MKYFPLLLLLFLPSLASAQCKDAVSTKDTQDCMDNEWKKSDGELNRIYQDSLKKLKPSKLLCSKKRNVPGSPTAMPSAKPTTKC